MLATEKQLLARITAQQTVLLSCNFDTDQTGLVRLLHEAELRRSQDSLTSLEFIVPEKSSLGIAVVRELQEQLRYAATAQRPRWIAILRADTLTVAAQNALLKTLEEPPPHTVFLLVTASPVRMLPTITSRALELSQTVVSEALAKSMPILNSSEGLTTLTYATVTSYSLSQACERAEEFSDKEQAIAAVQQLTTDLHAALTTQLQKNQPSQPVLQHLQACVIALRQLEANCNVKLVMGEVLLNIAAQNKK